MLDVIYFVAHCATQMRRNVKDSTIRARCPKALKNDVETVAYLKGLDAADIIRMAVAEYVQKFRSADVPRP